MNPVYTIGHSTRTIEEFTDLLREYGVQVLCDVRRYPGSRRLPQFGKQQLATSLAGAGIEYLHVETLGGRRQPRPDSPNTGWRNPQFRGYADHMDTPEFRAALSSVIDLTRARSVAIMCAEALPWRCHRQLIADALVARGVDVRHIVQSGSLLDHQLRPNAMVADDGHVVYPATGSQLGLL